MKNYLSFGGGVNSVAGYLYMYSQGIHFEAVFADTGCEWPETYQYIKTFNRFLKTINRPPITIITAKKYGYPAQRKHDGLYEFYWFKETIPHRAHRDCSDKFKIKPKDNYFYKPCFNYVCYDAGEMSRHAKFRSSKGVDDRFPLIEAGIDREGCKKIIKSYALPVPPKSACYICFNATHTDWRNLRVNHPGLFCKAQALENRNNDRRRVKGLKPIYLSKYEVSLSVEVGEKQSRIFKQDEYPQCICMT